jgi:site-specific recombinase XerD
MSNQGKGLSLRIVNHITQKTGQKAGITNPGLKHINPHIFCHSIARFLKSKGLSAEWIQNFLGHESFKTTMDMYGTISIDKMQEVAEKSWQSFKRSLDKRNVYCQKLRCNIQVIHVK